jgi:YHS domain-containing protein
MQNGYEVNAVAKDPICGMSVDEKSAKFTSTHQGKTYYFCSPSCKEDFDKTPSKYA